jgi:uncharacterized protein (DUF2235 family)
MAKTLIFCADGTWNGPGKVEDGDIKGDATNVYKLFANLAGDYALADLSRGNEQEKATTDGRQVAKYIHGVGDSGNWLVKLLGGGTGAGVITRILRGYTFVSRNYQPGDAIILVGFSRGAYTVRALAGMISRMGLLDAGQLDLQNKELAYRKAAAVWRRYRALAQAGHASVLADLASLVELLPGFFTSSAQIPLVGAVKIKAVAVWDTVGAMGIPVYADSEFPIDVFQFADRALSATVEHGVHFVAVDEQRADFTPTLWDADPRVKQVLYPGAHADVGGGYPTANKESGLSDGALVDMQAELALLGVAFVAPSPFKLAPAPFGSAHKPWLSPPFNYLHTAVRTGLAGLPRSASFTARRAAQAVVANPGEVPQPYNPPNVP